MDKSIKKMMVVGVIFFLILQLFFVFQAIIQRLEGYSLLQMLWLYICMVPHLYILIKHRNEVIFENRTWILVLFYFYYTSIFLFLILQDFIYNFTSTTLKQQYELSFWGLIPLQVSLIFLIVISLKNVSIPKSYNIIVKPKLKLDFSQNLNLLISKNKIVEAIDMSILHFKSNEQMSNDLALLKARWRRISDDEALGTQKQEDLNIEKAKLISGLQYLIQNALDD